MEKTETLTKKDTGFKESDTNIKQYLTFRLGKDIYGLNISNVREVIEYDRIFKIAKVSKEIKGVINLRGEVVPVIDLGIRFFNRPITPTINTGIIITEIQYNKKSIIMGAIIDEVKAVVSLGDKNIEQKPEIGTQIKTEFINCIGKNNNNFIIILDINRVLDISELSNKK